MIYLPSAEERTSFEAVSYGLKTLFKPSLTKTLKGQGNIERFEDLKIDELMKGVRALILDVDGTLTCGNEDFSPAVVEKLREIRAKMPACVYCNQNRRWPIFEQLGIPEARNLPDKPDPRGFIVAKDLYLKPQISSRIPLEAESVATIGDNHLTDGGCRAARMQFIHVNRLDGPEGKMAKAVRQLGNGIAGFHRNLERIIKLFPKKSDIETGQYEGIHPLVKALYEPRKRPNPL